MIWFAGDPHGHYTHVIRALNRAEAKPAAVIFLGDMGLDEAGEFEPIAREIEQFGTLVWFIHGNHDSDLEVSWRRVQMASKRNIHGRVIEIDGLRIAGLGGVFRGEIWYPDRVAVPEQAPKFESFSEYEIDLKQKQGYERRVHKLGGKPVPSRVADLVDVVKNGKLRKHASSIFPETVHRLSTLRADILVTHEAPSCHHHGFETIDILAVEMGVKKLFHGHHHDRQDYCTHWPELGFEAYSIGYCGITGLDGNVVVEGKYDCR